MKISKSSLLDTMVLVYAAFPNAPYHETCKQLCDQALGGERQDLCITPQVLVEFFATVTNPKRVDPPRTVQQAREEIKKYQSTLPFVAVPYDILDHLIELLGIVSVTAQDIFDLQLAAIARATGIASIVSYDDRIFGKVTDLSVVRPEEML